MMQSFSRQLIFICIFAMISFHIFLRHAHYSVFFIAVAARFFRRACHIQRILLRCTYAAMIPYEPMPLDSVAILPLHHYSSFAIAAAYWFSSAISFLPLHVWLSAILPDTFSPYSSDSVTMIPCCWAAPVSSFRFSSAAGGCRLIGASDFTLRRCLY